MELRRCRNQRYLINVSFVCACPGSAILIFSPDSDYIQIRAPVYISHSAGRYAAKRFRKAQCPIIERLTNSLMMNGRNNGKKLMAIRIVAHAFEIVRCKIERHFDTIWAWSLLIKQSTDSHHDRPEPNPNRC